MCSMDTLYALVVYDLLLLLRLLLAHLLQLLPLALLLGLARAALLAAGALLLLRTHSTLLYSPLTKRYICHALYFYVILYFIILLKFYYSTIFSNSLFLTVLYTMYISILIFSTTKYLKWIFSVS